MKTLQRQGQPAKAPEPKKAASSPPPGPDPKLFTAGELDVAEQLVLLSGSSTSTGGTPTAGPVGSAAYAASGSSSPRSVNNAPPAPAPAAAQPAWLRGVGGPGDGDEEEDEQEVAGSTRKTKRCRPIAEIYRETGGFVRCSLRMNKE